MALTAMPNPLLELRVCDPNRTYALGTGSFHFGFGWL